MQTYYPLFDVGVNGGNWTGFTQQDLKNQRLAKLGIVTGSFKKPINAKVLMGFLIGETAQLFTNGESV